MKLEEIHLKLSVADKECNIGNFQIAEQSALEIIETIDSFNPSSDILEVKQHISIATYKAKAIIILAKVKRRLGNYQEAVELINQALHITKNNNLYELTAGCYNLLGIIYDSKGSTQLAVEQYDFALQYYQQIQHKSGIAKIFGNKGVLHKRLGEYDSALECYIQALTLHQELQEEFDIALVFGNIGSLYFNLGEYYKSLDYYDNALTIHKKLNEQSYIALITGNIGGAYFYLGIYELALEYLQNALAIHTKMGEKSLIASTIGNIGNVYLELQNYDDALEYIKRALSIVEEIGENIQIAHLLNVLGRTYSQIGNKTEAMEYYLKALQFSQEILYSKEKVASIHISIGELLHEQQQFSESIERLQIALKLAEEIGEKKNVYTAHKELTDIYEQLQKTDEALYHFKKYHQVEKEVQSDDALLSAQLIENKRMVEESEKNRQIHLARLQEQEKLLHNILPIEIANRILKQEFFIADFINSVSVLFFDIVNFTSLSSIAPPKQLVFILDNIFTKADEVVEQFGLEKIKTIGDGYLAVANVTTPHEEHQKATALAALQLLETMNDFTINTPAELGDTKWSQNMKNIEIRIGIHTGEVVAGVIGKNKYTYDLWGDAVNIASRMESNSEAGRIHISEEFAKSIEKYAEFSIIPRGEISIKGKGTMNTFWLERLV